MWVRPGQCRKRARIARRWARAVTARLTGRRGPCSPVEFLLQEDCSLPCKAVSPSGLTRGWTRRRRRQGPLVPLPARFVEPEGPGLPPFGVTIRCDLVGIQRWTTTK